MTRIKNGKEAFVFPGQGSQKIGMGGGLRNSTAEDIFNIAEAKSGLPLKKLCLLGVGLKPEQSLDQTEVSQLAILVVSMIAFLNQIEETGEKPGLVSGHSLGEYTALFAAGGFSIEDVISLVIERARLMKEAGEKRPGRMAAIIGLSVEKVETLCERLSVKYGGAHVTIANINSPMEIIISGDEVAILDVEDIAKEFGAKLVKVLPVSIAAHSDSMASAQKEMKIALRDTEIKRLSMDFISPTSASFEKFPGKIRKLFVKQLTDKVFWQASVELMIQSGYGLFLEVGPGNILTKLFRRIDKNTKAQSLNV